MITGETRLAGVMATPIKHSLSPLIHNTGFTHNAIDSVYLAFDVSQEELPQALESIKVLNMLGVNLSMPLKQLAYELVDQTTAAADLVESINTIVHHEGQLIGYNTDGMGFMASLAEAEVEVIGKKITVLGTGGGGLAIIAQAALDGVKQIYVFKRKGGDFDKVKEKIYKISRVTNCLITLLPLEEKALLKNAIAQSHLLVNATSVGMSPNEDDSLISETHYFHDQLVVADIVYQPEETKLLALAKQAGCLTVNGLGMLIHQAASAFELWTETKLPIKEVKEAVKNQIK